MDKRLIQDLKNSWRNCNLALFARRFTENIILIGAIPVDESKVDPIPWLNGHSYKNSSVKLFDQITESVALVNKVHWVPLYEDFSKSYKYLYDGVHPNSLGHKKIFEKVKGFLLENKLV